MTGRADHWLNSRDIQIIIFYQTRWAYRQQLLENQKAITMYYINGGFQMRYCKLIISIFIILLMSTAVHVMAASIPLMIPYSGTIALKEGPAINGNGQFKFAIVSQGCEDTNDATPCTAYWTNDGSKTDGTEPTNFVDIIVTNGSFAVKLGDTSLTNMPFPLLGSYFTSGN